MITEMSEQELLEEAQFSDPPDQVILLNGLNDKFYYINYNLIIINYIII